MNRQRQGTKQADASGGSGVSGRTGGAGGERPALPNVMGLATSDLGATGTGAAAGEGRGDSNAPPLRMSSLPFYLGFPSAFGWAPLIYLTTR